MWTDLSMKDKSDLMSLFLKQGIGSLSDMKRIYDGEEDIPEDSYYLGELEPAVVTPKPVQAKLTYYPISKRYPISHSELIVNNRGYAEDRIKGENNHSKVERPLIISKGSKDFDYNLINANCSDETGNFLSECFNTNFTKGITTPIGLQDKVKKYLENNSISFTEETNENGSRDLLFDIPWYNYRLEVDKQLEKGLVQLSKDLEKTKLSESKKQQILDKRKEEILNRRHPDYKSKYRIYDGTQDFNNNYQMSLNEYSKYKDNNTFTSDDLNVKPADINYQELALRQRYAESSFNNNAVSNKGATGAYGIMPHIHKWYIEETGDTGDLTDLAYNTRIRDWLMKRNLRSDIHSSADIDSVRVGKQLSQYNYGSGNTRTLLKQLEDKGIDTHTSFEWLDYFPKETRDYINFTLRNKDINQHKNTEAFNRALKNLKK